MAFRALFLAGASLLALPTLAAPNAPAPAAAAEPAADAVTQPKADQGEILVTARRRAESAQKVPIALTVLSAATLNDAGAFNVNRMQQLQPSLQFYSSNPRNSAINIRGLGAPFGLTNDGIEQGVGFYLDGVYIGRIGASTFDFVDVDRVEVLRGPQGTLYGKNTTAGAVNVTTRAPSFTPEARVEASYGNYNFLQVKASASTGLVDDKLAVRLSTSYTRRDGTIYDTKSDQDLHRLQNFGFRGQLLWKPTDNLSLNLAGDYNVQNPLCCVQYYARVGATQRPVARQYAALAAAFGYTPPSTDPFNRVTDLDASINSRQAIGGTSLVANWDIGPATITSVSAWRYWDWKPANDRDFTGLPITTVSQNPSHQTQESQELRIASNGSNKLDYTAGLFYFHQKINTNGSQVQGSAASRFLLSGADANNPNVLNGLTSTNTINFNNSSFAVFGKLNWEVLPKLRIQPGLRVNYDKKSGYYNAVVSIANSQYNFVATADNVAALRAAAAATSAAALTTFTNQTNTLAPQRYSPEFSQWNVSGDVTASYDFSSDIHGYATYARSFKSGGINLSGLPLNSQNTGVDLTTQTVKPEKENHYEIGLKTQFADRRITLNLAAFWTDIKDYQATVNNNAINVIRGYLANAAKVRVRGIEWDSSFRPTPRLSLYVNGAYTDAKYIDFKNAPCPPELTGGTALTVNPDGTFSGTPSPAGTAGGNSPPYCNISGQVLPGVSKWSFSYGAEVNQPSSVFGHAGEFYLGYDGSYRTRFSSNPSPSAYTYINGYALSNIRLGFRTDNGWNIFGWVRNALDKHYFELLSVQSGSTGLIVGQPADPRTYGVTVAAKF
ncbi:iron complex outermembrane receptor protein [Sphingomonas vulcanisoli]|uniref:Iron complex outermembrane receptor protein n=1 Tax=Sphingomonas vulcanisoli TaxID=1658060 RepID=A0ABX0TPF2_9SPHN|nr:TonB-dependent receptor [Sphingomonas vulcanisoli]NIJ06500.1 iron complex outermembrane receptor protein [Sphingomonas vulcanisoli]